MGRRSPLSLLASLGSRGWVRVRSTSQRAGPMHAPPRVLSRSCLPCETVHMAWPSCTLHQFKLHLRKLNLYPVSKILRIGRTSCCALKLATVKKSAIIAGLPIDRSLSTTSKMYTKVSSTLLGAQAGCDTSIRSLHVSSVHSVVQSGTTSPRTSETPSALYMCPDVGQHSLRWRERRKCDGAGLAGVDVHFPFMWAARTCLNFLSSCVRDVVGGFRAHR